MAKQIVTADRRRHAKKLGLHFLEGLAGIAAVCACVIAFYVWQYANGSISLSAISPNIKDAISKGAPNLDVDFSGITFHRPIGGNLATVLLKDISIGSANESITASVPEAAVSFEMTSLAAGKLRPYRIVLRNGEFDVAASSKPAQGDEPAVSVGVSERREVAVEKIVEALEEALAPLFFRDRYNAQNSNTPVGSLRHVMLSDFVVRSRGAASEQNFRLEGLSLTYQDNQSTAEASGNAILRGLGDDVPIKFAAERAAGSEEAALSVSVGSFRLNDVLDFAHSPWSERIKLAPNIELFALLSSGGKFTSFEVYAQATAGEIDLRGIELGKDNAPVDGDPELDALQPEVERPKMGVMPIDAAEFRFSFERETAIGKLKTLALRGGETDLAFEGSVQLTGPEQGRISSWDVAAVDVRAVRAALQVDGFYEETVRFSDLQLNANIDRRRERIEIKKFQADIDGSRISAAGITDFAEQPAPSSLQQEPNSAPAVRLTGALSNVPITTVVKLWPAPVAMGARDWIHDYVDTGVIPSADFEMDVPAGYLGTGPLQNEMLTLAFQFEGGTAHYIPGLTPLTGARGTGKLSGNRFDLTLAGGQVGAIKATGGSILMPRLVPKGATSEFRASLQGQASEILSLIDMPPLNLMTKFGMDPNSIGGSATTQFVIGRPNRRVVPVEMITYRAEAQGKQLSIREAMGGLDLSNGALALVIDPKGIEGEGTLSLAGIPAKLKWRERFGLEGAAPPTEYDIDIDTTSDRLTAAGFAVEDMISGRVKANIRTKGKGVQISSAVANADLRAAAVNVEAMNWLKPEGKPANVQLRLETPFRQGDISGPSNVTLNLTGHQANVRGSLRLAESYKLLGAEFPSFKLGTQTDCAISIARLSADDGLKIDISGQALNAASFVRSMFRGGGGSVEAPLDVRANVARVWLNDGVVADGLSLVFKGDGKRIEDLNLEAELPDENKVFAWLTERTDTQRQMTLSTTNAGMLFKGLTGNSTIIGGTIDLDAFIDKEAPSEDGGTASERVHGTLNAQNFQIVNMPVLGRLLQAGSLQGLSSLLNGEGLQFERMDMEFDSRDGVYVIRDGQISGPSLGLTAKGTYNRNEGDMNVNGTLVPIYSVNRLFGVVPGINRVLASREGEGLLGFTYQIKGPPDEARISVNPLSALAPGFLRRLFQLNAAREQSEAVLSASTKTSDAVPQLPAGLEDAVPQEESSKKKKSKKKDAEEPENKMVDLSDRKADSLLFEHPLRDAFVVPRPKPKQR